MKKNNRKGFTIVELVIVIAVIAILAAVLIPTFSGVISDAKESAALQEARNAYTEACTKALEDNKFTAGETAVVGKLTFTFDATGKCTGVVAADGFDYNVSVSANGEVSVTPKSN